ncbi:uncharacterized protein LOC126578816 [Anopheles aquasalis]|uniref:uncharacterized protein LOC126578816 n=1 Tax=Anopheles aquasalis TaxID=42839 RepID=UPI00215AF993|nr:uncharacterized protein LOC126578816 [Anopheles aquasalis]
MFKILCLLAVVAAVAVAMPNDRGTPVTSQDSPAPKEIVEVDASAPGDEASIVAEDDMDKAETFGFGYRKIIHVYPRYYHHGWYYPRYYHGYHHYW